MCFDGSSEDGGSENDGYISFADMFDGGGPGRSGARFSGAGVGALDQNKDNYISEAEYLSGEQHSISNKARNISGPDDGPIGYAYDNRNNFISGISNTFGALPRGSIRQEAALGSDGRDISTSGAARFLQGFAGDARDMAMAPVQAYRGEGALPDPVGTPEQQARSFDSIFNKGSSDFNNLPEAQRNAIIRGTRSLNPRLGRAVSVSAPVAVNNVEASTAASTADASGTSYVVNAEDMGGGMVKVFYGDNSSEIMPAINYQLMMQNYV